MQIRSRFGLDVVPGIRLWFLHNNLMLNENKSQVLVIGNNSQLSQWTGGNSVTFTGTTLGIPPHLKSLGVLLERTLSFHSHISKLSGSCYAHIRALKHIRPYLAQHTANTLACSIVFSRLDYCNYLFYGISSRNLSKLQRIQNSLSRVVTRSSACTPSAPLLKSLHWLPVPYRVRFKIACISFN